MAVILLLIACILPVGSEPARCDQIELNRVYNDDGQLWLEQVIFWRWEPTEADFVCHGWRRWQCQESRMRKIPGGWRYEAPGISVECREFCESWTQYDREAVSREIWPIERRAIR